MTDIDKALDARAVLDKVIEQTRADSCMGCAFMSAEEWEMPCLKCKRNCKDYWRRKGEKHD